MNTRAKRRGVVEIIISGDCMRGMRELTYEQKRILDEWIREHYDELGIGNIMEKMPFELWEKLKRLNDFETIYQEVENYIIDTIFDE